MNSLICYLPECGRSAAAFGILRDLKHLVCSEHLLSLQEKTFVIFDLDGFQFIQSLGDAPEYGNRIEKRTIGRANLDILKTMCESEQTTAQKQLNQVRAKALMLIDACYQHEAGKLNSRYQEIKHELEVMQEHIASITLSRDSQLSRTEELLTNKVEMFPRLLRAAVSDIAYTLSEMVLASVICSTESLESLLISLDPNQRSILAQQALVDSERYATEGKLEFALDALHGAKELGDSVQENELEVQLAAVTIEKELNVLKQIGMAHAVSEVLRVIEVQTAKAQQEFAAHQIYSSVKSFEYALSLRSVCFPLSKDTSNAYFDLGLIYYQYLDYLEEAEAAMNSSLTIENSIDPNSEEAIRALNYIGLMQLLQYRYTEAEGTLLKSREIAETSNPKSEMLVLCFLGKLYTHTNRKDEAHTVLIQGYTLSSKRSIMHALSTQYLGDLWSDNQNKHREAEKMYIEAIHIFQQEYRSPLYLANCLCHSGGLLLNMDVSSSKTFDEAIEIYQSFPTAHCLYCCGRLLYHQSHYENAEEKLNEALIICKLFSRKQQVANCLYWLGCIQYRNEFRLSEAEWNFRDALNIYRYLPATQEMGHCSEFLATLLDGYTSRADEAEHAYREAINTYRSLHERVCLSTCLFNFGLALAKKKKRHAEALQLYHEGFEIYKTCDKDSYYIRNITEVNMRNLKSILRLED